MAKTREFLLIWDSTMANPNGDMLNENRPRQDEETGKLEVSDVRIKRFIRESWINNDLNVLVQEDTDEKGKLLSCASRISKIQKNNNISDDDLKNYLVTEFIDVKLFGAVVTKPKIEIMGPLQIVWSKSIHEASVKFMQGNAAYPAKDGKQQASIWSKYISPYALFKTYAVYNDLSAKRQGINVEEEDVQLFKEHLINGLKHYRSTSKNQMARVLVEVIYKDHYIDGELNYIDFNKKLNDIELREINDVEIDISKLGKYYIENKDKIEMIRIYQHPSVNLIGINKDFDIISI